MRERPRKILPLQRSEGQKPVCDIFEPKSTAQSNIPFCFCMFVCYGSGFTAICRITKTMNFLETTTFRAEFGPPWSCVQFFQRQDELDTVPEPKKPQISSE